MRESVMYWRVVVRDLQREWPLRAVNQLRVSLRRQLARLRWAAWLNFYGLARAARWTAMLGERLASNGLKRNWYVVKPWTAWGEVENLELQWMYDHLAKFYSAADFVRRNVMVEAGSTCAPPRGLMHNVYDGWATTCPRDWASTKGRTPHA